MDEMLSYIFGGIQRNDKNIRTLNRAVRQQEQINFKFTLMFGLLLYSMHFKDKKQTARARALAKEIDKLKEEKEGE